MWIRTEGVIIVITTHEEHKKGGYFQKGCDECAKFIGHGVMKGHLKPEFETCPVCKKPMCFERMTDDMPHEYDVCNECGKHVCIECSKDIDTVPYCPECYSKKNLFVLFKDDINHEKENDMS